MSNLDQLCWPNVSHSEVWSALQDLCGFEVCKRFTASYDGIAMPQIENGFTNVGGKAR